MKTYEELRLEKMETKTQGFINCYNTVKQARTETPVNTKRLEEAQEFYGNYLYKLALKKVLEEIKTEG